MVCAAQARGKRTSEPRQRAPRARRNGGGRDGALVRCRGDCDVAQVLQRGVAAPCELLRLRETRRVVAAAVTSAVCPFSLTCRSLGLWG